MVVVVVVVNGWVGWVGRVGRETSMWGTRMLFRLYECALSFSYLVVLVGSTGHGRDGNDDESGKRGTHVFRRECVCCSV